MDHVDLPSQSEKSHSNTAFDLNVYGPMLDPRKACRQSFNRFNKTSTAPSCRKCL